ncbi:hypothetical protein FRC07_007653 [Ceratobasidium sp. 392]|nr:hypothetical protein FRC07_007653 [Ceratobasidium sp. 392]
MLLTTCFGLLLENGVLSKFVESLRPDADRHESSQAMTFAALDLVIVMKTHSSFEEFRHIFTLSPSFAHDSSSAQTDPSILIPMLWESRDKFLILCSRSLLPGCSLFLLVLSNLLSVYPKSDQRIELQSVLLQDLVFRLYLVGSPRDRQILHLICPQVTQNEIDWGKGIKSPEDSRVIAGAFAGFLLVTQHSANASNIPVDFMGYLVGFVFHATRFNPRVTAGEMIEVAETALQFLWLLLHDRGRIAVPDHHKVRFYAAAVYRFLGAIQKEHISTLKDRLRFAQMLAHVEIVALAGRVILLVLEEGKEFKNLELLPRAVKDMAELEAPLSKSEMAAPELFSDSRLEWAKVFVQIRNFVEMRWRELGALQGRAEALPRGTTFMHIPSMSSAILDGK